MADEEKNPFEGFQTTSAVDGVAVEDAPAPQKEAKTSVPEVDDEDDLLSEFSDQGDGDEESHEDVADDDDGDSSGEVNDDADREDDADQDDDEDADESDEDDRRKSKVPAKKRISELTKKRREAEREAAALRARVAELEAKTTKKDDDPSEGEDNDESPALVVKDEKGNVVEEPDPKKYKYGEVDSAYLRDLRKYDRLAMRAEIAQEQEQSRQEQAAQRRAEELNAARDKLFEDGGSRYDDFEEVVIQGATQGTFALDQLTFEIAVESEVGADILYHLAKNPGTSLKVAQMNEREKARYLGRLEAALETRSRDKDTPKKKQGPRAAPPPKSRTPRGRGGRYVNPAQSESFADFEAAYLRSQQKR